MILGFESVSFLSQLDERCQGGFAFGGFLAFTLTAGEFNAIVMDGAFKEPVVVGASGGDDVILGGVGGNGLQQFLKFTFGIFERGNDRESPYSAVELAKYEFTGRVKAAVEENSAEKGLKRICQSRRTIAATVKFFASAEDEMLAQAKLPSLLGERAAVDEFGARFRERSFAERREILVELASENELEDGITEEFEALVGLDRNALFVGDRGMGQSEPKESRVAESVTELDLEIVIVGHGDQKAPNSKLQAPEKLQTPNCKNGVFEPRELELGVWCLFGAWSLVLGAFIRWALRKQTREVFRARSEQVALPVDSGRVRAAQRRLVGLTRVG
jgi:hypothetical protein